jgi:hypothetical protein
LEISNDKYLYHLVAPTELDYLLTLNAYRTWVVYRRVVHYSLTPAKMTGAMTRHAHLIWLCSQNMVKPHLSQWIFVSKTDDYFSPKVIQDINFWDAWYKFSKYGWKTKHDNIWVFVSKVKWIGISVML